MERVVRGYEIKKKIGEGGFGAVYLAAQPLVEREVAIKIILPEYADDPDFVRRFEHEAQLVARLEHIHIVPLYDYWRQPGGAYLVMRLLRGGSLRDFMNASGGTLTLEQASKILDQISAGLSVAHRNGVIHRDLKPPNILLDEDGNAYLTDFGIAKNLEKKDDDDEGAVMGSPSYMSPEQIMGGVDASPSSDIYSMGIVVFEMLTGVRPFEGDGTATSILMSHVLEPMPSLQTLRADLPASIDAVVMQATAKEPAERYNDVRDFARAFRQAIDNKPSDVGAAAGDISAGLALLNDYIDTLTVEFQEVDNPYKGLRAFGEADADDFFGREELIQRLMTRLREDIEDATFLAVVGPSGSGKSSVVRAGVIPKLRAGELPDSENWFYTDMVPGDDPFENFWNALLNVAVKAPQNLSQFLQNKSGSLNDLIRAILPTEDSRLVLLIDQFEEVFTQVQDEEVRLTFLKAIHDAILEPDTRLTLLITIRADFYDRPLLYPAFGELIRRRTEVVLPMSPVELERAIVGPAMRNHLTVDTDLVAAIVSDVSEEPGALPLLQYALTEVFERREGNRLTFAAYRATGGVLGALARRAEEIYETLDESQKAITRQLFLGMVTPGDGTEDTRRRMLWRELKAIDGRESDVQRVLDIYGKYRLLTFGNDSETREPTVEVAHEAIIRRWGRLREWLDESRDDLRLQRRVAAQASDWLEQGRDTSFLISGVRLLQVEALLKAKSVAFGDDEIEFVQASSHQREAAEAAEAERVARELMLERRSRQRLRFLVAILLVAAVISIGFAAFAFSEQRQANVAREDAVDAREEAEDALEQAEASQQQAQEALVEAKANELTLRSNDEFEEGDFDLGLLLTVEAYQLNQNAVTEDAILLAVQRQPSLVKVLHGAAGGRLQSLVVSDSGRYAAAVDGPNPILWDLTTYQMMRPVYDATPNDLSERRINDMTFDGDTLFIGLQEGVDAFDVTNGVEPLSLNFDAGTTTEMEHIAANAMLVVATAQNGRLYIWDRHRGNLLLSQSLGRGEVVSTIDIYRNRIAFGYESGAIEIWELVGEGLNQRGETVFEHEARVMDIEFSHDGTMLATASRDARAILWDARDLDLFFEIEGQLSEAWAVSFSADDTVLAVGSDDNIVYLSDTSTGDVFSVLGAHTSSVEGVDFIANSSQILSVDNTGNAYISDIERYYPAAETLTPSQNPFGFSTEEAVVLHHPQLSYFVVGDSDNLLTVYEQSGGVLSEYGLDNAASALAFSPQGETLTVGLSNGSILAFSFSSDGMLTLESRLLDVHQAPVSSISFSADGRVIASVSESPFIRLTNVETWSHLDNVIDVRGLTDMAEIETADWVAEAIVFHPHEPEHLAVAFGGGGTSEVMGLDISTQEVIWTKQRLVLPDVFTLRFNSDGSFLVVGSMRSTVIVLDTMTGEVFLELDGHAGGVGTVVFSPDDRFIASGSRDQLVILWDLATGESYGSSYGPFAAEVNSLSMSADGLQLVAAARDGEVVAFNLDVQQWLLEACEIANRRLTENEWTQYGLVGNYDPHCQIDNAPQRQR